MISETAGQVRGGVRASHSGINSSTDARFPSLGLPHGAAGSGDAALGREILLPPSHRVEPHCVAKAPTALLSPPVAPGLIAAVCVLTAPRAHICIFVFSGQFSGERAGPHVSAYLTLLNGQDSPPPGLSGVGSFGLPTSQRMRACFTRRAGAQILDFGRSFRWEMYLSVALIYICPVTSDVEHLFMGLSVFSLFLCIICSYHRGYFLKNFPHVSDYLSAKWHTLKFSQNQDTPKRPQVLVDLSLKGRMGTMRIPAHKQNYKYFQISIRVLNYEIKNLRLLSI